MAELKDEVRHVFFNTSDSKKKTLNDIVDFGRLPVGWHYGKGGPIQRDVQIVALKIFRAANRIGFQETEASPGRNGELMVSIFDQGHRLDFVVEPDCSIDFYHEIDDEVVDSAENLTPQEANAKLISFGVMQWNLYGSFMQGTTARKTGDSTDWPSRTIPATLLASPLSA